MQANPFHIAGVASPEDFTDRERELARIGAALREPGAKLLVYGERRMGKTSALALALEDLTEEGGLGIMADFSTASSVADLATRVLDAATRSLGRRWKDIASDLLRQIGLRITFAPDPVTGLPTASFDVGVRRAEVEEQRAVLARVLDSIERIAEDRETSIAVVVDEFQEIHRFGGETAEWQLRGVIQHHTQVSYVFAGSRPHLVRRMLGKGRAFYKLFELLPFGPIDPEHMATWIREKMESAGVEVAEVAEAPDGGGASTGAADAVADASDADADAADEIVRIAGPRTRDIVQLARATFELARPEGVANPDTVRSGFVEVVEAEDDPIRALWEGLTRHQQNVLRAVAASEEGLTAAATLERFGLSSSAAVSQTATKFVEEGVLEKGGASGYRFDSPFMRGWVILNALPDMGIHLPPTFRPKDA